MKKTKKNAPNNSSTRLSPLLRSAFEVLEHGLWHFLRSETSTDMKFSILHVDQSVELVLKEKVRSAGKSIYKNPKETITIWGAYDIIENQLNCSIEEKPDLEMLHEERNNIQHKSATINASDASFYIEKALQFIKRFLKDEMEISIEDYIPKQDLDQILVESRNGNDDE